MWSGTYGCVRVYQERKRLPVVRVQHKLANHQQLQVFTCLSVCPHSVNRSVCAHVCVTSLERFCHSRASYSRVKTLLCDVSLLTNACGGDGSGGGSSRGL